MSSQYLIGKELCRIGRAVLDLVRSRHLSSVGAGGFTRSSLVALGIFCALPVAATAALYLSIPDETLTAAPNQVLTTEVVRLPDLRGQIAAIEAIPDPISHDIFVRPAETLSSLLARLSIRDPQAADFIARHHEAGPLIYPHAGQFVSATANEDGLLQDLKLYLDSNVTDQGSLVHVWRDGQGKLSLEVAPYEYEVELTMVNGFVGNSVDESLHQSKVPQPIVRQMHSARGQFVYPDIEIGFDAIRNYLNIYLRADGGEDINRYSDLLSRNRFSSILFAHNYAGLPLMDNTIKRIDARLGLKGNIGSRFMYDLYGGYARYHNMLMDAVLVNPFAGAVTPEPGAGMPVSLAAPLLPAVAYGACNFFYADFRFGWHSQDVTVDGVLSYRHTDLGRTMTPGFSPAPFSADVDVVYNWKKRIFVGLHCDAALARDGYALSLDASSAVSPLAVRLPGYADLGISAEYRFNRKASFWLYGGNLLDMTIQRTPLYCESGIYFTAGITLRL